MVTSKLDGPLAAKAQALETADTAVAGFEWPDPVKVLVHCTGDHRALEQAGLLIEMDGDPIVVGMIAIKNLTGLAALDGVVSIQSDHESRLQRDSSSQQRESEQAVPLHAMAPTLTGKGVIVGIIDSGVDIFHPTFINDSTPRTTRLLSLFDLSVRQKITARPNLAANRMIMRWQPPQARSETVLKQIEVSLNLPATASDVESAWETFVPEIESADVSFEGGPLPTQPITVLFGGKYNTNASDSRAIPDIFCTSVPPAPGGEPDFTVTRSGIVFDHAEINQALQQPDPTRPFPFLDADNHGTPVASVAAGLGIPESSCCDSPRNTGMAPGADLVVVRTPLTSTTIMQAMQFLFNLGTTKSKPTVINMSFGSSNGPHDGTDLLDVYCDSRLSGTTRRAIVAAAGNEGAFYPLPLVTQLPEKPRVIHPGGTHVFDAVGPNGQVSLGFAIEYLNRQEDSIHIWYSGSGRLSVSLTAPPSANGGGSTPTIQPGGGLRTMNLGEHAVTITSTVDIPASFHKSHIEVDIAPPPATGMIAMGIWTIQLHEVAGSVAVFDCWFSRGGDQSGRFLPDLQERTRTVISPASAHLVLAVGAYDVKDNQLGDFSARGPTLEPAPVDQRAKPEVCAPGVNVLAAVRADFPEVALFRPHSGTSLAAPYVTGLIALMFEANPALSHADITRKIRNTCIRPGPSVPPEDLAGWGSGRVNPTAAVQPTASADADTPILPAAAYPAPALPTHEQTAALRRRVEASPAGRTLATLVSKHTAEVRRLIDSERRVTVAWHRMDAPTLLRLVLGDVDREVLLPRSFGGKPLVDGLSRLLDELVRAGSPALRTDIVAHRGLVLAMPGAQLPDLDDQAEVD